MRCSIFYFDDEPQSLDLFQELFAAEHDVRTAATLSEARRMLRERQADIVISDQNMPEISGTEFLAEVSKEHPQSYRVMLTGTISVGEVIPEILTGIVQLFVPKPWTEQDMRRMLERACLQADLNKLKKK
jgi:two-component system response regulator HupR/HoxA